MLLTRLFRRIRREEPGSALAAVIGVMAVGLVLTSLIMVSVIGGFGFTSATRAGVQSQAAADAGIAAATAALRSTAPCMPTHSSAVAPVFSAELSYTTSATLDAPGLVWVAGCPDSSARFVKVVSTGMASARGVAHSTSGDETLVEAIYSGHTAAIPSGFAVYSYHAVPFNGVKILSGGSYPASVAFKNGNVDCTAPAGVLSEVEGDLLAESGSITIGEKCQIATDVRAGGVVRIDGRVNGDVTSASPGQSTINPVARIGGSVSLVGTINSWGARCASPSGWDDAGNACAAKQATGATSVTTNMSGPSAPTAPEVPEWADFDFVASEWTDMGYSVVTWPGDNTHCKIDRNTVNAAHVTALSAYSTPVVIDARNCAELVFSSDGPLTLELNTDIAFVAKRISVESFTARSATSAVRELRFIVPDNTGEGVPTCTDSDNINDPNLDFNSTVRIESSVTALAYSPCAISNSSVNWHGQMYGGRVHFGQGIEFVFTPMGLPGVDLGGGVSGGTTPPTGSFGALQSKRNIDSD